MAENEEKNLPDFRNTGVAAAGLEEGVLLHGQADGEPLIMTRVGTEVVAVGAECTHYGGPLEKGLVLDGTVRCPWHHACFSLRTGEALRAPALDPLPQWEVEERAGRFHVTTRKQRDPLKPTAYDQAARKHSPDGIVIIGAGAAGSAAAEMLRRCDYQGPLTMIDVEDGAPYDRPKLSKGFLAGEVDSGKVPLRPDGFYAEHGIDLIRKRVSRLDPEGRSLTFGDGSTLGWDALLLATGSEPRKLDIPGSDLPHVFTLRSWEDSEHILKRAENVDDAVVIGASFIGLEVAAALRERGVGVSVAAPEEVPLARVFGPEVGRMVKQLHEEHGVKFRLGTGVTEITGEGVTLGDGGELKAQLVIVGIGVTPRTELAEAAGLEVDGGVVVDEYLQTAAPRVYAAGDIARWPSAQGGNAVRVEHWVVAQRHGQAAARNMLGAREPFTAVPFFWSKHYGVSLRYSGHAEDWDDILVTGNVEERSFSAAFRHNGKILAVASAGRDLENLRAAAALEADDQEALQELF